MTPIPLNPEQQMAKEAPFRPLLIVAGAGTGKTRVLTARVLHLIDSGVPPQEITALTFTNKAAREMMERIEPRLKQNDARPYIGTFHSLGARILRNEARVFERTGGFVIFDDGDSMSLIKRILKRANLRGTKWTPSVLANKISFFKSSLLDPEMEGEDETVIQLFEEYEAELKKNNAFDFDDLLHKMVLLFRKYPERLKKYAEQFSHVLVDEYQDVNDIQYEFLKTVGEKAKSISVVGDSDQTIYTWRGSNIKIFLGFEKDWPDAQVVFLEQNYRSTKNIIRAASELISRNKERSKAHKSKSLWTANEEGEPITLFESFDAEGEAWWIAQEIKNKRENRKEVDSSSNIAVLFRTNAQSRAIEQALIAQNIPYIMYGGLKFYERREIKDILAGLRIISNPQDSISEERLEKIFGKRVLPGILNFLKELNPQNPLDAIRDFMSATNYLSYIEKTFGNAEERKENIAELVRFAGSFDSLPLFLERVALIQSSDDSAANRFGKSKSKPVVLATIHLAKGLEFNTVFVAGVSEGILPHAKSIMSSSALEEERRLLYVAMTRAKKKLNLSFYEIPSRFLGDIPSNCFVFESETSDDTFRPEKEERFISWD